MNDAAAALNALVHAAEGLRTCEHCAKPFGAKRKWARFCSTLCRKLAFDEALRRRIIREYLSGLGRKGAAARKAKRSAA